MVQWPYAKWWNDRATFNTKALVQELESGLEVQKFLNCHVRPHIRLLFTSLKLELSLRVWHTQNIRIHVLWSPIHAALCFQVSLESEIPTLQQLNQDNLDLIARKESSRAGVISVTKIQRIWWSSDVLMFVLTAGNLAKIVISETIELVYGLGRGVVCWAEGRCGGRLVDRPACKSEASSFRQNVPCWKCYVGCGDSITTCYNTLAE